MPKPTPPITNTVFFKAELTASITREKSGQYLAHCEALDLYSQGSTKREAEKNIIEATELFIQSCMERGTMSEVLQECGFSTICFPNTAEHEKIH